MFYVAQTLSCDISGARKRGQKLAHFHGVAVDFGISAVNTSRRFLPVKGGRSHLSAGHAVNRVIDEDDGDFSPRVAACTISAIPILARSPSP